MIEEHTLDQYPDFKYRIFLLDDIVNNKKTGFGQFIKKYPDTTYASVVWTSDGTENILWKADENGYWIYFKDDDIAVKFLTHIGGI